MKQVLTMLLNTSGQVVYLTNVECYDLRLHFVL